MVLSFVPLKNMYKPNYQEGTVEISDTASGTKRDQSHSDSYWNVLSRVRCCRTKLTVNFNVKQWYYSNIDYTLFFEYCQM